MPWKQWAYLEKIPSADFQTYLQNQVVPAFTSTVQRDTQWTTPPRGAMCVTTDTNTRWLFDGTVWNSLSQPRGVAVGGGAGQPAINVAMQMNTVFAGPAAWLAANTITLPVGAGGVYLVNLDVGWRSSAIVGISFEVTNSAGASFTPNMMVAVSQSVSTWNPCRSTGAWVVQAADGATFQVRSRGNAQTAPDFLQVVRLSLTRLGDALSATAMTKDLPDEVLEATPFDEGTNQ